MHRHPSWSFGLTVALVTLAVIAPPTVASPTDAETRPPLSPMDTFQLEYATDPRLSPDGGRVVYQRRSMDLMRDRVRSQLWLLERTESGLRHRPLTGGWSERSPRWSPSGDRVAFVAEDPETERAQIFVHWLDSRVTTSLTQLARGPSALTWSPDGTRLAYVAAVEAEKEPSWIDLPKPPPGAEWAEAPRIIEDLIYRRDGGGYVDSESYDQIFILSAAGGAPRALTKGEFDHSGPLDWAPDGSAIYFSCNRKENWRYRPSDTEVYRLDVAHGESTRLTDRKGPDDHPTVSPDGEWIAYVGLDDRLQGYQIERLYVMRANGRERRCLSEELDRAVGSPQWAPDGSGVFVEFTDHGVGHIAKIGLDGTVERIAEHLGGTSIGRPYGGGSFHVGRSGGIVFTECGPQRLADVAWKASATAPAERLTHLCDVLFAQRTLGTVREVNTESSADGRAIQGWLILPPGRSRPTERLPLILEIHGGPFADYGPRFAMELQLYAAAGYAVLYVNPRGSSSYGEEFGNLIHHAYPGDDYHDLMSAVDQVIADGVADPDRLFVTGGSGGGVLTAWIVGKTDRFRAAVVAKPVINWYSFVLTADAYPFFAEYWFPAMPWDAADHYLERSPISLVGNVETPTMLLTGEQDYRTPISETEQYYQALKLRRIETAMVRIPGAGHGIAARPSRLITKVAAVLGWFERHGKPKEDGDR